MKKRKPVKKEELARPRTAVAVKEERLLTRPEFEGLAEVPPEIEWFASISNPRTRGV